MRGVMIITCLTISYRRVTEVTDSKVDFGLIPKEHWVQPAHIDEAKATESRNKMMENNVIYGGTPSFSLAS